MSATIAAVDEPAWNKVRAQYLRLPPAERRRLRELLHQAMRLDRALGELHLVLPTIEVRFYGLGLSETPAHGFRAEELLAAIQRWNRGSHV